MKRFRIYDKNSILEDAKLLNWIELYKEHVDDARKILSDNDIVEPFHVYDIKGTCTISGNNYYSKCHQENVIIETLDGTMYYIGKIITIGYEALIMLRFICGLKQDALPIEFAAATKYDCDTFYKIVAKKWPAVKHWAEERVAYQACSTVFVKAEFMQDLLDTSNNRKLPDDDEI